MTLPICHVTGYPRPTTTWSRPLGKLPHSSVYSYLVSYLTIRPGNVSLIAGASLTIHCSATGDPQPVISWKRLGAQLPDGWNQWSNGSLTMRNVTHEDAGIYMCVATSGGVLENSAISKVRVKSGKTIA